MSRFKSPEPIGNVLQSAFKELQIEKSILKYLIFEEWERIVGKRIAQKASPKLFLGKVLVVKVSSHAWMNELSFMKDLLLKQIVQALPGCEIEDLKFEWRKF